MSSITTVLAVLLGFVLGGLLVHWRHRRTQQILIEENNKLKIQVAGLEKEQEIYRERKEWMEQMLDRLRETFQALAAEALRSNADAFLKSAREQLDTLLTRIQGDLSSHREAMKGLVRPLEDTLKTLDAQVRDLEQKRERSYGSLQEQLKQLLEAQRHLHTMTTKLESALRAPTVRGRWGEYQLRRVVEMAGMTRHVSFEEQAEGIAGRPDMIVRLPNGGILPVDAKTPMQAYLEAFEAGDEARREECLQNHVQSFRNRIRELGQRRYWEQFDQAPDFVVMFVPNEACLYVVFERDPSLLEYAIQHRVILTTPTTLLALLKTVAFGWQQHQIAENARQIAEQGRTLYTRLVKFTEHLSRVGDGLNQAVKSYNEAMGSLNHRLLPAAQKFQMLIGDDSAFEAPETIDLQARLPGRGAAALE